MSTPTPLHLKNFHRWIRDPVRRISRQNHTGFAVAMIAFPVLERWIRGKVGIGSSQLKGEPGEKFYTELAVQFEALRDPAGACSQNVARAFWKAFRHGIFHQATFSREPLKKPLPPAFCLFGPRSGQPIDTKISPLTFIVDPGAFAERVISIIESDFASYEAGDPKHHRLALTVGSITFAV